MKKIIAIFSLFVLAHLCFSFSKDDQAKFYLKITVDRDTSTVDLTQVKLKLILPNTSSQISVIKNKIGIHSFDDSASINIQYKQWDITTSLFSFSDFKNLDGLDVEILRKKNLLKDENTEKAKAIYLISENPKGHEIGRFLRTTISK